MNDLTLVVSSCDKYSDSWYPYFSLIKKFWPNHPDEIVLITENKKFSIDGLNIQVFNYSKNTTWSERLYRTLEQIKTKYIFFSLEDFFLLDYVKNEQVNQCIKWMNEDKNIAVFRMLASNDVRLIDSKYGNFKYARSDIGFRLETQAALWNRRTLMNFLDLKENPWQFESIGTTRIKNTNKDFLWLYSEKSEDLKTSIFPYSICQSSGYGIAWGHWLWNNRKWFEKNDIFHVKYNRLGSLSQKTVLKRIKHLYSNNPTGFDKLIRPFWRVLVKLKRLFHSLLV